MAALVKKTGTSLFCPNDGNRNQDRMNLSALMERLRAKRCNQSSQSSSKESRLGPSEKTWTCDDATALRKHQESVLQSIKAVGRSHIVDRLESIAGDVNVKFQADASKECVCLYTDEFSLKLIMDSKGKFVTTQISNSTETKVCPCLTKALNAGNFDELKQHLEGLLMLYCIDDDKTVRSKGTQALLSLESDLNTLSNFQRSISSVQSYIHKSPLGVVSSRNGGLQMKLTFFVGPYDLLNYRNRSMTPMTLEAITEQCVGSSATVGIESSSVNCMQVLPLIAINKLSDGRSPPTSPFCPLTSQNSALLPLRFYLRLHRPLVLSKAVINRIQQTTGLETVSPEKFTPLVALLMEQITRGKVKAKDWNRQSHVRLPDQDHRYCFSGNLDLLQGAVVSRVQFLHPTNVPQIIAHLRQQVLFNTVIKSCLRHRKSQGVSTGLLFEVTPMSIQQVTVTFEHPSNMSLVTAELDLSDLMAVGCKLGSCPDSVCPTSYASMVFQRCLSLPVTLRSIIARSSTSLRHSTKTIPVLLPRLTLECLLNLQRRKQQSAQVKKSDPHAAMKLSAPLFIASNCIPSARGRQAVKNNRVLRRPGSANRDAMGVKELAGSCSCWETSAQRTETEKRLKRMSENIVTPYSTNAADVKALGGNVVHVSSSSQLTSSLNSQSNAKPATGSAVGKRESVASEPSKDVNMWSDGRRTPGLSLPNVNRPIAKPLKDSKAVVIENLAAAVKPNHQTVPENSLSVSSDSNSLDASENATLKRPRTSFANPELVSLLSEPLPGQGPPPKRPHLEKQVSETSSSSEQTALCPNSVGNGSNLTNATAKPQDGLAKPLTKSLSFANDADALSRLEAQLLEANAGAFNSRHGNSSEQNSIAAKNLPVKNLDVKAEIRSSVLADSPDVAIVAADQNLDCDFHVSSNEQKPSLDQRLSFEQKSAVVQRFGSPSSFDGFKIGSSKVNCETKLVENVKTEIVDGGDKGTVSSHKLLVSDEDKPPIKVIFNKRTLQQGLQSENLFPMAEHGIWREKQRDRKLCHSIKSSPSMPEYIVDLSTDTEVDGLTSDGIIAAGIKISSGRSSASPQVPKSSDRKDGARLGKRPKTSRVSTHPGDKRLKKEEGRKSSKKKKASDDDDNDSIADDTSSASSSVHPMEKITTIKITNSGGKLQIQNPVKDSLMLNASGGKSPTVVMRGSGTLTPTTAVQRVIKASPSSGAIVANKVNRPAILGSRVPSRSKSEHSAGGTGSGGVDSKLNRTPTVKLKPLAVITGRSSGVSPGAVMPYAGKLSVQLGKVGGFSGGLLNVPGNRARSGTSAVDSKLARRGSLSSVIDTLYKKQHSGSSGSSREVGVVDQQKMLDAIRLQIIREGNKPSAPIRDSSGSIKSSPMHSAVKRSDSARIDPLKSAVSVANKASPSSQPKLPAPSKTLNGLTGKASVSLGTIPSMTTFRPAVPLCERPQIMNTPVIVSKAVREPLSGTSSTYISSYEMAATASKPYASCTLPASSVPLSLQVSKSLCDVDQIRPSFAPVVPPSSLSFMGPSAIGQGIRMMGVMNPPGLGNPAITANPALVSHYGSSMPIRVPPPPTSVTAPNYEKPLLQGSILPVPGHSSKLNEITNRLARRHFTDVVGTGNANESNGGVIERRLSPPRSPSPVDESRLDMDGSVDCSFPAKDFTLKVVDFSANDVAGTENREFLNKVVDENEITLDPPSHNSTLINHVTCPKQIQETELNHNRSDENLLSEKNLTVVKEQQKECFVTKDDLNSTSCDATDDNQNATSAVIRSPIRSRPPIQSPDDPLQEPVAISSSVLHVAASRLGSSPVLESSSSGDSLSIDYLSSPTHSSNVQPNDSAATRPSLSPSINSSADVILLSPFPTKQSSPWSRAVKSPTAVQNNQSSPVTPNSACNSEDDLMDVALTL